MFLLKLIRKLFKGLSGAESPTQIALGFGLGLTLGFVPFSSGMGICLLIVILICTVSFPFAMVAWALGAALRTALLAGLFVKFGHWILMTLPLQGLWTFLLKLPLVALLKLESFAVMGGTVFGLLAGAALFAPVRFLVTRYRERVVERLSESKLFKFLTKIWLVRALKWILIG